MILSEQISHKENLGSIKAMSNIVFSLHFLGVLFRNANPLTLESNSGGHTIILYGKGLNGNRYLVGCRNKASYTLLGKKV